MRSEHSSRAFLVSRLPRTLSNVLAACLLTSVSTAFAAGTTPPVSGQPAVAAAAALAASGEPATASEAAAILLSRGAGQPSGEIHGIVEDPSGDVVPGATITVEGLGTSRTLTTEAAADGAFSVPHVPQGPYRISIVAPGFKPWLALGTLGAGESLVLSNIALPLTSVATEIEVSASAHEVAAAQLGLEEKQRIFGVIPNYYASYLWNAEPLTARQKFSLAWRFSVDPVAFGTAGLVAGTEQASNSFSGYGQGTLGYAKRFGAVYADGFSSTMLGQAILPVVFHQDPRYFVKGTGSITARALYAMASTVICRSDNRRWQANYSNILGNVTSASISNIYYPSSDRHGASLTLENSMVTTALGAVGGLFQEFLLHRLTPHIPDYEGVARQ